MRNIKIVQKLRNIKIVQKLRDIKIACRRKKRWKKVKMHKAYPTLNGVQWSSIKWVLIFMDLLAWDL